MKKAEQLLHDKNLRITPCRVFVLGEFLRKGNKGLSEVDIEKRSAKKFDRVTIYRTLKTYVDSHVLHKVIDDDNVIKYALCNFNDEHHNHEHVHFKCNSCLTTSCLDELSIVNIDLPKGYKKTEANYLIVGTCPECN